MKFLEKKDVLQAHHKVIERIGGSHGLRDEGLLDSAIAAPQNRNHYEQADLSKCAATLAYHLVLNHPFVDGNKRVGAAAAELFLELNNSRLEASNDEIVAVFFKLAAGELSRPELEEVFEGWSPAAEN